MLELRLEPWSELPQARWVLIGAACVLLSSLFFFALPTVTHIRFGIEALPTTLLFECIHALQNAVLAAACAWVFQRIGGCAGLRWPWLMVAALVFVGVGGDLLLHWGETVASQAVIERGRAAVFASALLRTLPQVAPYTPVLLWLLAGAVAVRVGRREKCAGGADAYALVLMGLLPGIPCVLLLQLAQIFGGDALFVRLPLIMLGVYALGVPLLAWGAVYLGRPRPVLPEEADAPALAVDSLLMFPEAKEGSSDLSVGQ